jgi:hypothetical protein
LEDSAQNAAYLALYVGKSAKSLAEAVANARRLGTSIESQTRTAQQFETFDDALSNAFMIQFITGETLNAQSLYVQSNMGNALDIQEKMVSSFERWMNMGPQAVTAQRELAKAMGISLEEMGSMISFREKEREILKELSKIDPGKSFKGDKDLEFVKRAYLELQLITPKGKKIEKEALYKKTEEIKSTQSKLLNEKANLMLALDITSLTTTTDKLAVEMTGLLQRILNVLAGPIATGIETMAKLALAIFKMIGGATPFEAMSKEQIGEYLEEKGVGKINKNTGKFDKSGLKLYNNTPDAQNALSRAVEVGLIESDDIKSLQMENPFLTPVKMSPSYIDNLSSARSQASQVEGGSISKQKAFDDVRPLKPDIPLTEKFTKSGKKIIEAKEKEKMKNFNEIFYEQKKIQQKGYMREPERSFNFNLLPDSLSKIPDSLSKIPDSLSKKMEKPLINESFKEMKPLLKQGYMREAERPFDFPIPKKDSIPEPTSTKKITPSIIKQQPPSSSLFKSDSFNQLVELQKETADLQKQTLLAIEKQNERKVEVKVNLDSRAIATGQSRLGQNIS